MISRTERLDSRESEFPPTPESVKLILKSTIIPIQINLV